MMKSVIPDLVISYSYTSYLVPVLIFFLLLLSFLFLYSFSPAQVFVEATSLFVT